MIEVSSMGSCGEKSINLTMDKDSFGDSAEDGPLTQYASLLECVSVLAKLAAMDTNEYQQTVLKSPSARPRSKQNSFLFEESLAALEKQHSSTDTPVAKLAQSIHKFQSNLALLQHESDNQAAEVASLQDLIISLEKRNNELEKEVSSLTKKNNKMAKKLREKSREKKCLVDHVKTFIRQAKASEEQEKELEELKVAYKLQAHEHLLMEASRNRTASVDSNLSDGLDFLHTESSMDEAASMYSVSTEEGVGSLQLSTHANSPTTCRSDHSQASYESLPTVTLAAPSPRANRYTLKFPRGTKVGVKILEIPIECGSALTPTVKPHPDLTRALLTDDDVDDNAKTDKLVSASNHNNPFSLNFQINIFNNKGHQQLQRESKETKSQEVSRSMFVVSGYCGFDCEANAKPPIGARVVGINNVDIPDEFTLKELIDSLAASSAADLIDDAQGQRSTYSVTFRNDPLTAKQREILHREVTASESVQSNTAQTNVNKTTTTSNDGARPHIEKDQTRETIQINKNDMKLVAFNFGGFMNRGNNKGNHPGDQAPGGGNFSFNRMRTKSNDMIGEDGTKHADDNFRQNHLQNALAFFKPKNTETTSKEVNQDLNVSLDSLI